MNPYTLKVFTFTATMIGTIFGWAGSISFGAIIWATALCVLVDIADIDKHSSWDHWKALWFFGFILMASLDLGIKLWNLTVRFAKWVWNGYDLST